MFARQGLGLSLNIVPDSTKNCRHNHNEIKKTMPYILYRLYQALLEDRISLRI